METSTTEIDSRSALIAAAKKIFANRGYDGTTVKDLADEAKVNVSLISYHFNGKEGLYRACIEETGRASLPMVARILQEPETLEEFKLRLQLFIEEFIRFHAEENDACAILHREVELELPVAQEVFARLFLPLYSLIEKFFVSAQKSGFIRTGVDIEISINLLLGGIKNMVLADRTRKRIGEASFLEKKDRKNLVFQIIHIFLEGVSHHESSHAE